MAYVFRNSLLEFISCLEEVFHCSSLMHIRVGLALIQFICGRVDLSTSLIRGQRSKLSDLGLGQAFDVQVQMAATAMLMLAVVTDDTDRVISQEHVVLNQTLGKRSPCGTLESKSSADQSWLLRIDLNRMPPNASKVVIGLALDDRTNRGGTQRLAAGQCQLRMDDQTKAVYAFTQSDFTHEKSLIVGAFYRKDNVWRFVVHGSGFFDGITALLNHFNLPIVVVPAASATHSHSGSIAVPTADVSNRVQLPLSWPGDAVPRVPAGLTSSVNFIMVEQNDGSLATGTGFFVSPGGHLITCYHVIENAKTVTVRCESAQDVREARVLASDEHHDLALLWLGDGAGTPHWLPLELRSTPQLGDELGLLGYPLGMALGEGVSYSQGIVNGLRQHNGTPFLQIDTGAAPGSSGGPIFRRDTGRVIGVLHGGLNLADRGMIINLGIDIRNIQTLGWVTTP